MSKCICHTNRRTDGTDRNVGPHHDSWCPLYSSVDAPTPTVPAAEGEANAAPRVACPDCGGDPLAKALDELLDLENDAQLDAVGPDAAYWRAEYARRIAVVREARSIARCALGALTRAEEARIPPATVRDHWCDDGWHVVEPDSRRCICGLVGVTAPDLNAVADPAETEAGTWEKRYSMGNGYAAYSFGGARVALSEVIGDTILREHALAAQVVQATSLLRRYNMTGESKTLDADVIKWLHEQRQPAVRAAALDALHSAEVGR